MVIAIVRPLMVLAAASATATSPSPAPPPTPTSDPAASALSRGEYPWYDSATDSLKPVSPPARVAPQAPPPQAGAGSDAGQIVIFVLMALILAGLLAAIVWNYHRRLLEDDLPTGPRRGPAREVARTGPLPAGLEMGATDLMAEASRLRAAGDYAGALVHLFAHQLLELERARVLRLAPGRTARQLVRSVSDDAIRALVSPALKLFEDVNYGHIPPSPSAFEAVWERAGELDRLLAAGAVS